MKVFIAIGAVIILFLAVGVGSYISYSNSGARMEEAIDAQVAQNQNKYSSFTQSAVENMGVASAYKDALKDVITAGIQGRYGADGAKPLAIAVKEAYPTIDPAMFSKVQTVITSGRLDFADEQKTLISKVQVYKLSLRYAWSGMWLKFAGYPTIDLKDPKYNPIISGETGEAYKTGVDKGIKFGK